jgi:nitrite reductase (cytochrome c-552)
MKKNESGIKPWKYWLLFAATIVIVFLLGLFSTNIIERRSEKAFVYKPTVVVDNFEPRNEVWGKNFPMEYESYMKTNESGFASKYGGNLMRDMLEEDPRLVVLWAGYAFSKDYNQGRGHYYAIEDIHNTLRTGSPKNDKDGPQPATCWSCKSPDVSRVMAQEGVKSFYTGKWARLGTEVVNNIGCADCHNNVTMELQISRPALIEAYERQGKDISKASRQEMRSLVCAQCHVEYYFDKKTHGTETAYLTFPWDKGMTVEAMERYYDSIGFTDWVHQMSKAPMLKAQHPDYETFLFGTHYSRGVSCADCHMPYMTEGSQKYTDHHIQSPLNNIANSCMVCHKDSEEKLKNYVYANQDRVIEARNKLEEVLVRAHVEAKTAWDNGASDEQMKNALQLIRHAQWRWDYCAASHGAAFHASLEISRIISSGIDKAHEARLEIHKVLATLGYTKPIDYPDIDTKEKAQKYIGLDVEKLKKEKEEFLKNIVPEWKKKAAEREAKMQIKYF